MITFSVKANSRIYDHTELGLNILGHPVWYLRPGKRVLRSAEAHRGGKLMPRCVIKFDNYRDGI